MNPGNRERVKELLDRAAQLAPALRSGFIRKAAGDDSAVAAEALELLQTLDDSGFMNAPTAVAPTAIASIAASPLAGETATVAAAPLLEGAGTRIGRYKLLQKIGEGGFGAVWLAEQREPVKRRVALKVIKLGMDTRQVIARFEAERQALAMMDHPNIAKVLDAGATDAGRPYFVMELVRGIPITQFCDHERLDTKRRLELFALVCNAVQHAHTKGIIHRDIKPSNVLVTLHDGVPVPKVIDFGIAKATNAELTEKTLFTEHRQMIGTPAYMSPEQAEMSGLDIDTRSDVYSLGVLLYELLTGTPPFDPEKLRSAGYAEIVRIIREDEPPRPSLRLSSLGERLISVSQNRHIDPRRLRTMLRGELDVIVMKCLEKDRTRRYETASGLGADVRRYLSGEPIEARRGSVWYILSKTMNRYRAYAAVGIVSVSLLVVGTILVTMFAFRAQAASDDARREADKARVSELQAAEEAARSRDAETRARTALEQVDEERVKAERATAIMRVVTPTIETDHFVAYYTAKRESALEVMAGLERIYRQVGDFMVAMGLQPATQKARIDVFYFESYKQLQRYNDLVGLSPGQVGWYDLNGNRCIFADLGDPDFVAALTGLDRQVERAKPAAQMPAGQELHDRRPRISSAYQLRELRHEGAHAAQFNLGLLRRSAFDAYCRWELEGLAILFEVDVPGGPLSDEAVNSYRLFQFRRRFGEHGERVPDLGAVINDNQWWFAAMATERETGLTVCPMAWALIHYLSHAPRHTEGFRE